MLQARGTPIFKCRFPKTPLFSPLLIQRPLKIFALSPKAPCFLSFWSKIADLPTSDPMFLIFDEQITSLFKNKWFFVTNFHPNLWKKHVLFGISSPKDHFFVQNLTSHRKTPSFLFLWFLPHQMPPYFDSGRTPASVLYCNAPPWRQRSSLIIIQASLSASVTYYAELMALTCWPRKNFSHTNYVTQRSIRKYFMFNVRRCKFSIVYLNVRTYIYGISYISA